MAKFTVTLFEIGDRVAVRGGEHVGSTGVVANWGHIGSRDIDVVHYITLDKPKVHTAVRETAMAGNKTVVEKEDVTLDVIEAKSSDLELAV